MRVDAAAVLGVRIDEVVGESDDGGPLKSDLFVQIGVADACVCCPVAQSHARQTGGIVDADGNTGRRVNHEIVHVLIPFQRRGRIQVSESEDVVGTASR